MLVEVIGCHQPLAVYAHTLTLWSIGRVICMRFVVELQLSDVRLAGLCSDMTTYRQVGCVDLMGAGLIMICIRVRV